MRLLLGNVKFNSETAWMSWAKAIAIAGVVAIHVVGFNAVEEGARSTTLGRVAIAIDAVAVFAVPLFVMVSGALLLNPARYQGSRDFLKRRALRLVPAIVFWHLFYWVFLSGKRRGWVTPHDYLAAALNGKAFQGLYYLWLILGLCLITPILMPWIAQTRRRYVAIAACGFSAMPVLTIMTRGLRGHPAVWVETPWTWWIFYLGLFLFGWVLREVIVTRARLAVLAATLALLGAFIAWAWKYPDVPALVRLVQGSYFSPATYALTIGLFILLHSVFREHGAARVLMRGRAMRVGQWVGGATLGIFTIHPGIIVVFRELGFLGETAAAPSLLNLAARVVTVFGLSCLLVALARQIPFLRRVV